jgi:hypothetical protein
VRLDSLEEVLNPDGWAADAWHLALGRRTAWPAASGTGGVMRRSGRATRSELRHRGSGGSFAALRESH